MRLPFSLPDLMRRLARRWDQMPWPSHLPYTVLREGRTRVVPLGCSWPAEAEKLGVLVHRLFESWDVKVLPHPCMDIGFI